MTTYNDLIAYAPLATYAGNRDMLTELPRLVRRAQNYLVQRIDHDAFASEEVVTTVGINGSLDMTNMPVEMLEIRAVFIEGRGGRFFPLLPRAENMLATLYAEDRPGVPAYYARLKRDTFKVYPRPSKVTNAKYRANVAPDILGPTVQTNILTEDFPEAIEVALLREAALFNLDVNQAQIYEQELIGQLGGHNAQVGRTTRDETVQRPKDPRNATGR